MDEYQVFAVIQSGTPLLGTFPVRDDFFDLGSAIYELNPPIREGETALATHIVMFVGCGERKGAHILCS